MLSTRKNDPTENIFASLPSEIIRLILNKLPLKTVAGFLMLDTFLHEKYRLETYRSFLFNHAITQLAIPELRTYFLTRGGFVYGCGRNFDNTLGTGRADRQLQPVLLPDLKDILEIFWNEERRFFLHRDGSVYAVGKNLLGQLGVNCLTQTTPVKVDGLPPIKKVIIREKYTFFLAHNGDVYACGDNSAGMLGVRDLSNTYHFIPHKLTDLANIEDIAVSPDKVYFISRLGKVFAYGANLSGHLGMGDKVDRDFPEQIQALNHVFVKQVFVNGWSTFFLTDTGQVYACGSNSGGRLGCGDAAECISPQLIDGLPPIKKIFMRDYHAFFLAENGDVYVCGKNLAGELGIGDLKECRIPQKLTGLSNIEDIQFGAKITYFLRADGNMFACGRNINGELGFLDKNPRTRPELVTSISQVSGVHARSGSAFFHTKLQKTFVAGKNKSGELGLGSIDEGVLLQANHALSGVATTYLDTSSAMFLRADGQVLAAGENRAGELGLPELKMYSTPQVVMFNDVVSEIEKWSLTDVLSLADIAEDSLRHYLVNRAIDLVANLDNENNIANILPALGSGFWMQQAWVEGLFPCYMSALQITESCKSEDEKKSLLTAYAKLVLIFREVKDVVGEEGNSLREQYFALLKYLIDQRNQANQEPVKHSMRLFHHEESSAPELKTYLGRLSGVSIEHLGLIANILTKKIVPPAGSKRLREEEVDGYETTAKRRRIILQ